MAVEQSRLTAKDFQLAGGVRDWRVLGRGAAAWFTARSHRAGAELAAAALDHARGAGARPPEVDIRHSGVRFHLRAAAGGLRRSDVHSAQAISAHAAQIGLAPDPAALGDLRVTIDALQIHRVLPFWERVLGYTRIAGDELVDPDGRHPSVWFQQQDRPRLLRNRIHLDVVRPYGAITAAMDAARAAGTRAVAEHGYYATLSDAEGNEVDLLPLQPDADRWQEDGTADWRVIFAAMACYRAPTSQHAVDLARVAASLTDEAGLQLGIDIRPGAVTFDTGKDTWTQDTGYAPLAAAVQRAAQDRGLTPDPGRLRFVQVGIDAVDIPEVRAFWRAVLGYVNDGRPALTDIVDPRQLNLPFFFQRMDPGDHARRAQRNRIYIDTFVPDDQAAARIEAALAAGGRMMYDGEAPWWWTLADPEGNEVDISVAVGREEAYRAQQPHS